MLSLKANVRNGRIVLDEPTELPDGAVVDLVAVGGQALEDLEDEDRQALHVGLEEGIAQDEAGDTVDADEVLARLRTHVVRDAAAGGGRDSVAPDPPGLLPLPGMSDSELVALSRAVLASERQRRMKTLLQKSAATALSERNQQELDALMEEADRIALLKARAMYTLAEIGRQRTASA
jgi:hypothetical protein